MNTSVVKKKLAKKVSKKSSAPRVAAAAVAEKPAVKENPRYPVTEKNRSLFVGKVVRIHNAIGQEVRGYGRTYQVLPTSLFLLSSITNHRMSSSSKEPDLYSLGLNIAGDYSAMFPSNVQWYNVSVDAVIEVVSENIAATPETRAITALASIIRSHKHHDQIGTDPELFIVDKKGALMPAFDFLHKREGSQIAPYYDGYQAEFGTHPTTCLAEQNGQIEAGLIQLRDLARAAGGELSVRSTFDIPPERLANDADEHVAFGCTPSLSLYGETFPTADPRSINFRTAGGHMHFSFSPEKYIPTVIRELDRILSVIAVSMYQYYDEPRRRMVYGRAGEYRLTKYGFEYRTPGPSWLVHPFFINFQFELARRVMGMVVAAKGKHIEEWDATEEEVRECINTCDVALAHKIIARNKVTFDAFMVSMPGVNSKERLDALSNCVMAGGHTVLLHPDRINIRSEVRSGGVNLGRGLPLIADGSKI